MLVTINSQLPTKMVRLTVIQCILLHWWTHLTITVAVAHFWGPIPSIRLLKPHDSRTVNAFLSEKHQSPFNHEHSGKSENCEFHCAVPANFRELNVSVVVGSGERDYMRATQAMHKFDMVDALPWAKIITTRKPKGRLAPGTILCTLIRCYGVAWSLNPCRVVYSTPNQVAYSTVVGHLIEGEERFRVQWRPGRTNNDGDVVFSIYSYTKGAGLLGTAAMPFIRPIQHWFFRDVAQSMKRIVAANTSSWH